MAKITKERIEEELDKIHRQDVKNQFLINKIKSFSVKDLEEEHYNNLSQEEKDKLKK